MTLTKFTNETEITDDWTTYIENEANALSKQDDFEIDNYADREVLNPDVQAFLEEMPGEDIIIPGIPGFASLSLSFKESNMAAISLFGGKIKRLKGTIRKFLCQVLNDLAGDGDLNWKDIIKAVLVLLIPALGGGVWAAIVLPILISLIAKIIKRGLEAVCPVMS